MTSLAKALPGSVGADGHAGAAVDVGAVDAVDVLHEAHARPSPAARLSGSAPALMWWGSLSVRVVMTSLVGSVVVLLLGGFLLLQQASIGLRQGKVTSVVAEASAALDFIEQSFRNAAPGQATTADTLTKVASEAVQRGAVAQYQVVVEGPVSDIRSAGVDVASVPDSLRDQARQAAAGTREPELFITETEVRYLDGRPPVPGLVVAATATASGSIRYPVYFVFPMTQEAETLAILQRALITTGLVVLLALAATAYGVSRQVSVPVREARQAAERLASGDLSERMPVRGRDDLARLAVSMNLMASELQGRIRELEELSRLQQRFVSDVSHELRTPLTTIRLAADLLYESRDTFPALEQRSAVLMRRELDRFEGLLGDLLEISRFDAGAAVLTVDDVNVAELVRNEVESLAALAQTSETEIRIHSEADEYAEVDARRVSRVVRNLVTNAIEHGEAKPIDIYVVGDDTAVAITVRDHGIGFKPEEVALVFGRFWRADPARSRVVGGTGLGLAIAQEDIHLHHGRISAWGMPGQGARFRIVLPRHHGDGLEGLGDDRMEVIA